ncbi:copper resistance system multicopper oxidase [Motiliproteus sp. MSK22-1]|uniref:copper resistance system multicopper oxidase n=1 Tax=Motiliproteus sp. MSK22-1 TaxID=1897630 RepID=UPI00097788E6|nr:copper resistance system multicopper oxidase [Motiliproteus sp. MSK22-1]OMH31783.1 copper resistance protein CopA [Motiliproteus sp. MSK22-1]
MYKKEQPLNLSQLLPRRQFVKGLALGGVVAGLGIRAGGLIAAPRIGSAMSQLQGNRFDLTIDQQAVNLTGTPAMATTVNQSLPAPVLRMKEGERVTINVTNLLSESSSIHWHGLILPYKMDGVPGIAFPGIAPGETFRYSFDLVQSGTYWYHSHSGYQEQTGVYGAIVVDPKEPEPFSYDRDYVVMLSDWSDEDPSKVYAKLKKMSDYYNFSERTVAEAWREIKERGVGETWRAREMWNKMRMSDRDISDVTGYTYTFLMNGQTPSEGWKGLFRKGEKVRLRFINSAAMTFFDVRIPGLKMTVVAADGQYVEPVSVDEFRIGVAETFDVIVEPSDDRAYTLFAQAMDRSGYARGTLTPDYSLEAQVPELDPMPILSHGDMGMSMDNMEGMGHSMASMKGMEHPKDQMQGMNHSMASMKGMEHPKDQMQGMSHSMTSMKGMEHPKDQMQGMNHSMASMKGMEHPKDQMQGMNHSMTSMKDMEHSMGQMPGASKISPATDSKPLIHAATEYGPHVDSRADNPQYRLSDPGVGLRGNGRRVLSYADLRNLTPTVDRREPSREIDLHLTGNMARYMWSINGVKYSEADPIRLKYGERVRINFVNDTMMNHPMHLHGMWSELETGDNRYLPRKHTIVVQPGARISYQVTADAMGQWAFHCHLIYHMAGMFREVHVS